MLRAILKPKVYFQVEEFFLIMPQRIRMSQLQFLKVWFQMIHPTVSQERKGTGYCYIAHNTYESLHGHYKMV